jgi:hypothetical protein
LERSGETRQKELAKSHGSILSEIPPPVATSKCR